MAGPTQRRVLTVVGVGGAICIGLAFVSAWAPPALITSIPPVGPDSRYRAVVPTEPPISAAPIPSPLPDADLHVGGDVLSVLGAILALLAVVAVALIILRIARAAEGRTTGGGIDDVVTAPAIDVDALQDVLRRAHEQILLDDDANRAVVRCWESVEALGARGGVTRGPSETAAEYVIGILSALDAPAPPAVRLSRLYQRALFSAERLPPDAVALALADLAELDAALARPTVAGRSADAGSVVDS